MSGASLAPAGIVTITLNRPEKLNAFIGHMRRDLAEALEAAGSDRAVRVVVITGAGRAFCAGGDITFMAELIERHDSEEFSRLLGAAARVVTSIRKMTKPVIAAVNGPASGAGCNLALACDLRIASTTAGRTSTTSTTLSTTATWATAATSALAAGRTTAAHAATSTAGTAAAGSATARSATALRTKLLFRTSHSATLRSCSLLAQRQKQRMCHIRDMQAPNSLRNSRHN